jgi:hypothetical protein
MIVFKTLQNFSVIIRHNRTLQFEKQIMKSKEILQSIERSNQLVKSFNSDKILLNALISLDNSIRPLQVHFEYIFNLRR